MEGLTRRWKLADGHRFPGGESLLSRVMAVRGIIDHGDVEAFLRLSMADTHEPGLLPGVDTAADRLVEAVRNDESIVIYGDYDVDGITATAILWHVVRTVGPAARIRSYVPHRLEEGYGLNADSLRKLADEGVTLVITVNCGITALDEAGTGPRTGHRPGDHRPPHSGHLR